MMSIPRFCQLFVLVTISTVFLYGCQPLTPPASSSQDAVAPTVASFFVPIDTPTPHFVPTLPPALPQSAPELAPTLIAAATRITLSGQIVTKPVYADSFDANWTWQEGTDMEVDPASTKYVHSGQSAIAMTPTKDFGQLFFSVRADSKAVYLREKVLGVTLWLNTGDGAVQPDDLAIAVVGSNAFPFWVAGDDSVAVNDLMFFSETRLYYLDVDRTLPPQAWVKLEVWLDELPYDPDYKYVTGFYVKNDQGFFQTVYIDDVALLMLPE